MRSILHPLFLAMVLVVSLLLGLLVNSPTALAANADPYVLRFLEAREPVSIVLDAAGQTRSFSPAELSRGKRLFDENCKNCHVGGATLPDPTVPLSLSALQAATPPRNTIDQLVAFMRQPMTYDGSEETYVCRQVPEGWLSKPEAENLAAFILRAAEKAPGWGTTAF